MISRDALFEWITRIYRTVEVKKIKQEIIDGCIEVFGFQGAEWFDMKDGKIAGSFCGGDDRGLKNNNEINECLRSMASEPRTRKDYISLGVQLDDEQRKIFIFPVGTNRRLYGIVAGLPEPHAPVIEDKSLQELCRDFLAQAGAAIENQLFYNDILSQVIDASQVRDLSENMLESMTDGLVAVDMHGRILRINRAVERNFRVRRDQVTGRVLWETWPQGVEINWKSLINRPMTPGQIISLYDISVPVPDGARPIRFNVALIPMFNKNEMRMGTILIMEFMTEKFELMKALEQSSRLAAIGQFAAGIAHQLRNPLGIIKISADHIAARMPGDEKLVKNFEIVRRQVERSERIINGLMDFARERKEERVIISLRDETARALKYHAERIKDQGVEARFNPPGDVMIRCGPGEIQEILGAVIDNALDAMPRGGKLEIELDRVPKSTLENYPELFEEMYAGVTVLDSGPGIDPGVREKIFEPFVTTREGHLGLGLSSAYGLVRGMRGLIDIVDTKGQGSAIRILIPSAQMGT